MSIFYKFWNIYIFIPGPRVVLSENIINFSQIDLGYSVNKTLEIINESDVEAAYQVSLKLFSEMKICKMKMQNDTQRFVPKYRRIVYYNIFTTYCTFCRIMEV